MQIVWKYSSLIQEVNLIGGTYLATTRSTHAQVRTNSGFKKVSKK